MPDKILVLHQEVKAGAREDEKDTVLQAQFIVETLGLIGLKAKVFTVGMDLSRLRRTLLARRPNVVFNLVESLEGRGEFIHFAAGVLESLSVRFTGSSARALFLTSHKLLAKQTMRRTGIPTPDWFTYPELGGGKEAIFPCLRKSVWEHASIGMDDDAVIASAQALETHPGGADDSFFYERFIDGREFNLSLVEENGRPRPLVPVEILFTDYPPDKPKIVGYRAKWASGTFEYKNTQHGFDFPETDKPLLERLRSIACLCWEEFGLSGYARVDFRVDAQGQPWVLEINANPCLTPDAGFYINALRSGFSRESLFETIVKSARIHR